MVAALNASLMSLSSIKPLVLVNRCSMVMSSP